MQSAPYDVLSSDDMRSSVKSYSNVKTLPQLFINGQYVGGSDDMRIMHENGDLVAFLASYGVSTAPTSGQLQISSVSKDEVKSCAKASKVKSNRKGLD